MKKLALALAVATAATFCISDVSAAKIWNYRDNVAIDLSDVSLNKTTNGHEIMEFTATETIQDGTVIYSYVYDRTEGTIQVKEMEKKTKKLHYKSNFTPVSVNSSNPVIRERAQMAEDVYQKKFGDRK